MDKSRTRGRPRDRRADGGNDGLGAESESRRRDCRALHTAKGRQRSEGRALQLDVGHGHAQGPRRARHGHVARISGQGHDPGGRATVHAHQVPCEHELPDLQPADSVGLHAGQRPGGLEHRGGQRAVQLERRHRRRGDRSDEGEGHPDAGDRAGAADPHLGESSGRAEGRADGDNRDILSGGEPGHAVRRRCREGARYLGVVGLR